MYAVTAANTTSAERRSCLFMREYYTPEGRFRAECASIRTQFLKEIAGKTRTPSETPI